MVDRNLLDNLNRLGFPLMETEAEIDANQTLAEVVKSKDLRLWEGFAVLLANAAGDYHFDNDAVRDNFANAEELANYQSLMILSLALYQSFNLSFTWSNQIKKNLSPRDLSRLMETRNRLGHGGEVRLGPMRFDSSRLKRIFSNYFEKDAEKARQLKQKHEDLSLEYALSQIFSPKQKELFQKRLKGEKLTKTEKEYFSRTVKKKVSALANPELHRLSQKLMQY